MFSSQGQVSSIIITFLVDLEKSNKSARRVETAKNTGTTKFHPNQIPNSSQKLSVIRQGSLYEVQLKFFFHL